MRRAFAIVTGAALLGCGGLLPHQRLQDETQDAVIAQLEEKTRKLELEMESLREENRELRERIVAVENGTVTEEPLGASGTCEISRTAFEADRMKDLAEQARIVPSFANGTANGFKLFSIRPDSIYTACGFQNGDVVTAVNGMRIASPEEALDAYAAAKRSDRLRISVLRAGTRRAIDVAVVD